LVILKILIVTFRFESSYAEFEPLCSTCEPNFRKHSSNFVPKCFNIKCTTETCGKRNNLVMMEISPGIFQVKCWDCAHPKTTNSRTKGIVAPPPTPEKNTKSANNRKKTLLKQEANKGNAKSPANPFSLLSIDD
jgi:hypothetical protein